MTRKQKDEMMLRYRENLNVCFVCENPRHDNYFRNFLNDLNDLEMCCQGRHAEQLFLQVLSSLDFSFRTYSHTYGIINNHNKKKCIE